MSAAVGAALKKIAVALVTDRKVLQKVGMAVLVIVVALFMPMVAIVSVFSGTLELDTAALQAQIQENLTPEQRQMLQHTEETMNAISVALQEAQMPERVKEAQVLYILALYDHGSQPGFVSRLVSCFQKEQTDEQLIAVVNRTFGTDIQTEHFTQLVGNVRSQYVDTTQYVDFTTKNNLDLVQWAIAAEKAGWGYVWGTFGQVLSRDLLAAKVEQYPDNVGIYEEFIRSNYLGKRTVDCVGFIKGYSWYDPQTDSVNYGTNGMPDIGADQMYQAAREKGSISTIPEIPGLAVWHTGHIGVYIGDGYVIEAMGTHYGVVKTRLSSGRWTHWLKIPYINYLEETEEMP